MGDVFLSYAGEDRETARLVAAAMERRGWTVFWDTALIAGEQFRDVIRHELGSSRCVVVLWSENSSSSRWVLDEAKRGADRDVLVPAAIDREPIPLGFGESHAADLVGWKGASDHPGLGQLLAGIEKVLSGSTLDPLRGGSRPPPKDSSSGKKLIWVAAIIAGVLGVIALVFVVRAGNGDSNPTTAPPSATSGSSGLSESTSSDASLDCTINVDHIGAAIHTGPDFTARTIISVPDGAYQALDTRETEFVGKTFLWFLIDVDGRQGWIADDGIVITGKSANCP